MFTYLQVQIWEAGEIQLQLHKWEEALQTENCPQLTDHLQTMRVINFLKDFFFMSTKKK